MTWAGTQKTFSENAAIRSSLPGWCGMQIKTGTAGVNFAFMVWASLRVRPVHGQMPSQPKITGKWSQRPNDKVIFGSSAAYLCCFQLSEIMKAPYSLSNFDLDLFPCYTKSESENLSVVSDSLWLHGLYSPWNSPGQNTGVGSHSHLQGIFPTQGSNPGLLHCRWILYQMSHKGSPRILE